MRGQRECEFVCKRECERLGKESANARAIAWANALPNPPANARAQRLAIRFRAGGDATERMAASRHLKD
jgi:hypothetical protein